MSECPPDGRILVPAGHVRARSGAWHRLTAGIHDKIGEALPGSSLKSTVPMDSTGLRELKASLAEAMGKFSPDRTVLPIPDRSFSGTMGRTIDQAVADWSIIAGPKAPEGHRTC